MKKIFCDAPRGKRNGEILNNWCADDGLFVYVSVCVCDILFRNVKKIRKENHEEKENRRSHQERRTEKSSLSLYNTRRMFAAARFFLVSVSRKFQNLNIFV